MTKHFAGEASPSEETILFNWVKKSSQNEEEYRSSRNLFDAATRHYSKSIVPEINVEKEWAIFLTKVEEEKPVRQLTPASSIQYWMKIAASLLLLLASGAVIYYYSVKTDAITFQTAENIKTVDLPDGSTVILNRYSKLEYTSDFGDDNRNIILSGEAFFDVRKNTALPFIISARNTTIEVVGTSFNVLAYDSVAEVEVIVKSGVVRFTVPTLNKTLELTPGEKGAFTTENNAIDETVNKDVNYEAWNTHKLTFNETHLSSVIDAINKTYNANVVLTGPVSDSCLLTVSFDNQSIDAVLNVLENTLNLTFRRVENRIEIISSGC
jgi:ferric-dicitrate binding protein FerR (iron transport regulator)